MRYLIVILVAAALVFCFWNRNETQNGTKKEANAIQNVSSGVIRYGDETLESLQGNGLVTLEGTVVQGALEVNGSVKANKVKLGSLLCNGHATIQQSTVRGKTEVNGFLNALKTNFQGPIQLASQKIELQDCTIHSLSMKNAGWVIGSQTVRLKGNSVVRGDVHFESGEGKVILSPNSRIEGKVVGATVEKLEPIKKAA